MPKRFMGEPDASALDQARGQSVRRMIEHLHTDISAFVRDTPASDDLTMLALTLKDI